MVKINVIFNFVLVCELFDELLKCVDLIMLNEIEVEVFIGIMVYDDFSV